MNAATTLNIFTLKELNQMRSPIVGLIDGVKGAVEKLTQLRNRKDLHEVVSKYFPKSRVLRTFFESNPSAWGDFIRKLNKHKREREGDPRSVYVDEMNVADIMEVLLIRGRREDTGELLQREMRANLNNPAIIQFASKQPSILDGSGYSFSRLEKKKRAESMEGLIIAGLTNNIDLCNTDNVQEYFISVLPRVLFYLEKIFGLNVETLHRAKNMKDFIVIIQKMFDNPEKVEDAWMVIQAFSAWPRVNEIEELCENAKNDIQKIGQAFGKAGIKIQNVTTEQHITGTTLHHAELVLGNKAYRISWRVKTPESILQKMWQKSQYNNVDAMRDIIGINIIYPDGATDDEKKELVGVFSELMPDYGYLLKNKGAVKKIEEFTENLKKKPIAIKEEKSEMTHKDFTNMSLSGYMKLGKSPYGVEIQLMSESESMAKKIEDPYYKLRGALDAYFRGPKYRLPAALYTFMQKRVDVPYLESLGCMNFGDLFWKLITDGYLIAYRFPNKKQFFFSIKGREDAIRAIFPEAIEIEAGKGEDFWYGQLNNYVRLDHQMRNNAEFSKLQTSSPPPVLGPQAEWGDDLHIND